MINAELRSKSVSISSRHSFQWPKQAVEQESRTIAALVCIRTEHGMWEVDSGLRVGSGGPRPRVGNVVSLASVVGASCYLYPK